MNLSSIVSGLVSPIANIFVKKQETKKAKAEGEAKVALAKQTGATEITLTDQEWEAIAVSKQDSTWKDEYVTIVMTSPIVLIIVGSVSYAVTDDVALLDGAVLALVKLKEIGLNMGDLMEVVVYAAVGLKVWRGR